jgi:two-component system response regulator AtoC
MCHEGNEGEEIAPFVARRGTLQNGDRHPRRNRPRMPYDPRDINTEADASPKAVRLLAFWEGGFGTFTLPMSGRVAIGRLNESGIRIDHPSVSRQHAELLIGPPLRVVDLGSFNGTRVGGVRIQPNEPTVVLPHMVIEVGSTLLVVEGTAGGGTPTMPPLPPRAPDPDLVVVDERMKQLHRLLRAVAQGTISVLLLGETGVGKEVIARAIHRYSPRAARSFVSINCAAIPEALLESELFGHERGAFTGAVKEKVGLKESAAGGTLLLDEVGEMPMPAQAKVLRAIELREIVRVGGVKPRAVDVRFISSTNRDLEALVEARTFRRDLYFRLNGISVTVPPLRERLVELEGLTRRFVSEFSRSLRRDEPQLSGAALAVLRRHTWSGNVRELRNVVERALLLCEDGEVRPEHLSLGGATVPPAEPPVPLEPELVDDDDDPPSGSTLSEELRAMERKRILEALDKCAGNQTRAAEMLGITRRALIQRLETYGVPRPRKRP